MKLIKFSVTNYRSITKAYKISLENFTVLVGKNNEGKSNLLMALNIAMGILIEHGKYPITRIRPTRDYDWDRDFPLQLKERKNGLESIFKLEFKLEREELNDFHRETEINGNEDIPIIIKVDKDNRPTIEVPKKGSSSYNKKSKQVANFISNRLTFNYIQAVRTDEMAIDVLRDVISQRMDSINEEDEYKNAINKINELQQNVLDTISKQLLEPLKVFLPDLKDVSITQNNHMRSYRYFRSDVEIIIDDGIPTSISYKGDGIKSLVTLAILKDMKSSTGASIIAIEEPESHLHSGAIHSLIEVIQNISKNNQVIITTHNPLFVQRNNIKSNIIVNSGTAQSAKNIIEIRDILGVLPSDNLKSASHVLVVEGEEDKIILSKILSCKSQKINSAILSNKLIIKPLGGAGNLAHDILDLKNSMCKFFILLDHDEAGRSAIELALSKSLITEADYKLTICNGSPNSEIEDCLKKEVYEKVLLDDFQINLNCQEFRNNKKWSDRVKDARLNQGGMWNNKVENEIKQKVANCVSQCSYPIENILIEQKSGFINGLVESLERMLEISQ